MKDFSTGKTARTGYEGDYVLKQGVRHMRYAAGAKGLSEMRVVPAMENGKPQPMFVVNKEGQHELSDAFVRIDTVSFFGPGGISMVCPQKAEGEDKGPVHHFVDFIRRFVEDNPRTCPPDWRRWQGKKEDGDTIKPKDVLSRPSATLMVQGYLIRHKGEQVLTKEGAVTMRYPVALCIRASGLNDLMDKAFKAKDANAPWGVWNNEIGDLVDPERGLTLIVSPHDVTYNNRPQTWYQCSSGAPTPLSLADIEEVWAPWEDILDINPSYPELGLRIAKAFNATAVVRAFEKCPVYRQMLSPTLRDMASDEAKPAHSTGAAVPPRILNGAPAGVPPRPVYQAPSEQPAAWTPQEPGIDSIPDVDEGDDNEPEANEPPPARPAGPVDSIRDRVSSLKNRLQKTQ